MSKFFVEFYVENERFRISYIATIYRMSCVPEPNQLLNKGNFLLIIINFVTFSRLKSWIRWIFEQAIRHKWEQTWSF